MMIREARWTTTKAGLHLKKIMVLIWWEWCWFYKLLPVDRTINLDVYCDQLEKLKVAIPQKGPALNVIVFHHTRPHSLYLSDLAPSDFHLFCIFQNSLNGQTTSPGRVFQWYKQEILWAGNNDSVHKVAEDTGMKQQLFDLNKWLCV